MAAAHNLGAASVQRWLSSMSIAELAQRIRHEPQSLQRGAKAIKAQPQRVEQALNWQNGAANHHIISFDDPHYPPLLRTINDPPLVLFAKGLPEQLLKPAIAMVGSRNASMQGLQVSELLATELARAGLMVISGLASGIDGAAHKGALQGQGATVAVLGTGVDVCYPQRHQQLYQTLISQGCVISEFWPDTKPYSGNFPKRNRIISGIALGTVVVEARLKSGSLITARLAAEQGREVFAVPGGIWGGHSQGSHQLLKQGAKLVENTSDIIEEVSSLCGAHLEALGLRHHIEDNACELPIPALLSSVKYETTTLDEIVEHSGKPIDLVLEQILELELQGWVAMVPQGYVRLKRS